MQESTLDLRNLLVHRRPHQRVRDAKRHRPQRRPHLGEIALEQLGHRPARIVHLADCGDIRERGPAGTEYGERLAAPSHCPGSRRETREATTWANSAGAGNMRICSSSGTSNSAINAVRYSGLPLVCSRNRSMTSRGTPGRSASTRVTVSANDNPVNEICTAWSALSIHRCQEAWTLEPQWTGAGQDEQAVARRSPQQPDQGLDRFGVGPLQIIDAQQHRAIVRDLIDQCSQALRSDERVADAIVRVVGHVDPPLGQDIERGPRVLEPIGGEHAEVRGPSHCLVQQRGLAGTRVADHGERDRPSRSGPIQRRVDRGQLAGLPQQHNGLHRGRHRVFCEPKLWPTR